MKNPYFRDHLLSGMTSVFTLKRHLSYELLFLYMWPTFLSTIKSVVVVGMPFFLFPSLFSLSLISFCFSFLFLSFAFRFLFISLSFFFVFFFVSCQFKAQGCLRRCVPSNAVFFYKEDVQTIRGFGSSFGIITVVRSRWPN